MTIQGTDSAATFRPLTDALASHAGSVPGPAFTFVDYAGHRDGVRHSMDWPELDRRARAVAAALSEVGGPGDRVAVLCPQNLDYVTAFYGALYAGMIAVPLFAPEVSSHGERLVGALSDSDPVVWLTSRSSLAGIEQVRNGQPVPRPKQVLAVDALPDADFDPVRPSPDEPAYLQYTSGSTRRPAGAVISHRAVSANVQQVRAGFGVNEHTTCVGWLPFFHDMGLISLVCVPVDLGCPSVFTTPYSFVRRPVRWLRLLGEHRNVLTAAPNFAFEYAAAGLSEEDRETLDLSGVAVAINGSEPVRAGTVADFLAATGPLGFAETAHRPSYGLAEATVLVSTTPAGRPPLVATFDRARLSTGAAVPVEPDHERGITLVSAGKPVAQELRIVHEGTAVEDGRVGEIWLRGANVADGYWRQPDRSAETFDGHLPDAGGGWLRTGDLGVIHQDELFITGRLKDLIIVDGKNHYPQDIEATAQEAHPAIRRDRLAAFGVQRDGVEGPVLVAEHAPDAAVDDALRADVERAVRAAINQHHDLRLLDFVLVRPGTVRRTSSGKIARAATRHKYLDGSLS